MARDHLTQEETRKKLLKVDRERAAYYNQRTETHWGDATNYDLCLDTDWFGIDGAIKAIVSTVRDQPKHET